jgi:putative lipoic acid-binding regulatory protein
LTTEHDSPEAEQKRDLELIEACYAFPGDFPLSVIARNEAAVLDAIIAAATAGGRLLSAHEQQPSSGGKYISHRLQVRVGSAMEAHALRVALRGLDGVMTVL